MFLFHSKSTTSLSLRRLRSSRTSLKYIPCCEKRRVYSFKKKLLIIIQEESISFTCQQRRIKQALLSQILRKHFVLTVWNQVFWLCFSNMYLVTIVRCLPTAYSSIGEMRFVANTQMYFSPTIWQTNMKPCKYEPVIYANFNDCAACFCLNGNNWKDNSWQKRHVLTAASAVETVTSVDKPPQKK